ncbi:MAG: GntR family transcriptional regulator [Thermodesulfobacteriota bacterium]|nr:GntR family transcriptional regulator [Thermodesulfobacteriota bacterium]
MLKNNESTPLYEQLKKILRQQIEEGEFKPDQLIPSERILCQKYHTSRITVRQAISEMINEGMLYRKQGKGTFVSKRKINQGLTRIINFTRTVLDLGMKPSTRVLGNEVLPADFQIAKILDISITNQILKLRLLGVGDGEPLVSYESSFPLAIGKKMAREAIKREKKGISFSTYDLYGESVGLFPGMVNQTFEATVADESLASLMHVEKGGAIFMITSVFFTTDHRPLEFRKAMYRGDRYKFYITRELSLPEMKRDGYRRPYEGEK